MDLQLVQRAVAQGKVVLGGDGLEFSLFFGGDAQIQGDGHEDDPLVTPAARESKWIEALFAASAARSRPRKIVRGDGDIYLAF